MKYHTDALIIQSSQLGNESILSENQSILSMNRRVLSENRRYSFGKAEYSFRKVKYSFRILHFCCVSSQETALAWMIRVDKVERREIFHKDETFPAFHSYY